TPLSPHLPRADPREITEPPLAAVPTDEGEKPPPLQHAIAVEVRPIGPLAPPALAADAQVEVGWDANQPELPRIEAQAFLDHPRPGEEQGVLAGGPSEGPAR